VSSIKNLFKKKRRWFLQYKTITQIYKLFR
jgi:hypothetical protein